MTPEQLEDIREWAEWGDTTPSHMVHALLDHVDTLTAEVKRVEAQRRDCFEHADKWVSEADQLTARLEAVRELHQPRPNSASALYPEPLCTCGKEYPCDTAQAIGGTN